VKGTHWVQLAGGSNQNRMATEYRRLSAKAGKLLKSRSGYVTGGKDYFRLLVGPFASKSESQAFVNKLEKEGVDGFSWTRTPARSDRNFDPSEGPRRASINIAQPGSPEDRRRAARDCSSGTATDRPPCAPPPAPRAGVHCGADGDHFRIRRYSLEVAQIRRTMARARPQRGPDQRLPAHDPGVIRLLARRRCAHDGPQRRRRIPQRPHAAAHERLESHHSSDGLNLTGDAGGTGQA
jgi:hypothetical protein